MSAVRRALWLLAAIALAACSPTLTVRNDTSFEVRVVVLGEGGSRTVHLVRSGQIASGDVPEGAYVVTVVPDGTWTDAARATRDELTARLRDPDALGPDGVAGVLAALDDLTRQLASLEAAAEAGARCLGSIPLDGTGTAVIAVGADGRLTVTCSGEPAGTPRP